MGRHTANASPIFGAEIERFPVGDAHAMRAALSSSASRSGSRRISVTSRWSERWRTFRQSSPGNTFAFHFSGHGVAANGRNYLLPVDFPQPEIGNKPPPIGPFGVRTRFRWHRKRSSLPNALIGPW